MAPRISGTWNGRNNTFHCKRDWTETQWLKYGLLRNCKGGCHPLVALSSKPPEKELCPFFLSSSSQEDNFHNLLWERKRERERESGNNVKHPFCNLLLNLRSGIGLSEARSRSRDDAKIAYFCVRTRDAHFKEHAKEEVDATTGQCQLHPQNDPPFLQGQHTNLDLDFWVGGIPP